MDKVSIVKTRNPLVKIDNARNTSNLDSFMEFSNKVKCYYTQYIAYYMIIRILWIVYVQMVLYALLLIMHIWTTYICSYTLYCKEA